VQFLIQPFREIPETLGRPPQIVVLRLEASDLRVTPLQFIVVVHIAFSQGTCPREASMTKNCAEENRPAASHAHLANLHNRRTMPPTPREAPDSLSVKKCQS